ncbi:MAG TPA: trypsin-like serine protease [Vicinamibacterales bacterium]|nr:trypsin-like serine protease [Vicinamibacterales bacterium]
MLRKGLSIFVVAGAATGIWVAGDPGLQGAAQDLHVSVASDGSPPPQLPSSPGRIDPFAGTAAGPGAPRPLPEGQADTLDTRPTFRLVIGDHDERVPVPTPQTHPDRAIVYVLTPKAARCTGWLVGKDTVITAGHCVFSTSWADPSQVRVASSVSGERGSRTTPYPICTARRMYSTTGWVSKNDEAHDYAAIKLNCDLGTTVGWLGAGNEPSPGGKAHKVVGYDVTHQSQCKDFGRFLNLCSGPGAKSVESDGLLFYDADTDKGESGAPVIVPASCALCAVAIHGQSRGHGTGLHMDLNHGVRISERVLKNLVAWRAVVVR